RPPRRRGRRRLRSGRSALARAWAQSCSLRCRVEGEHGMDISTFYALFSATCFTLLGLWWNVLQLNSTWIGNPEERRAVGGIYLTFLLPALMGLFAQVGGTETPTVWRVSFIAVAAVGCYS